MKGSKQLEIHLKQIHHLLTLALDKNLTHSNTTLTFNLSHNGVGDDGAKLIGEALKTNTTLTRLYLRKKHKQRENIDLLFCLSRSGIRREGAEAIGEALKTNTTLVKLNLEENVSTQKILWLLNILQQTMKSTMKGLRQLEKR